MISKKRGKSRPARKFVRICGFESKAVNSNLYTAARQTGLEWVKNCTLSSKKYPHTGHLHSNIVITILDHCNFENETIACHSRQKHTADCYIYFNRKQYTITHKNWRKMGIYFFASEHFLPMISGIELTNIVQGEGSAVVPCIKYTVK